MAKWEITHLGGNYPSGQPLAGQQVPTLYITDVRRKDYGGNNQSSASTKLVRSATNYPEDTPELRRSYSDYSGMLLKLETLGIIRVKTPEQRMSDALEYAYQFPADINPATRPQQVTVTVVDANGASLPLSRQPSVRVEVQADAPGGATLTNSDGTAGTGTGVGAYVSCTLTHGTGYVMCTCNAGAGVVKLKLVDETSSGLDVSDTIDLTFA